MAICFDLFCPECDHIHRDAMISNDDDGNAILPECSECGAGMKKVMGTTSFELKYDNRKDMCDWDGNTSRYWEQIKTEGGEEPKSSKQPDWY